MALAAVAASTITLSGYLALALSHSPEVQASRESLSASASRQRAAVADAALPTISASAQTYPWGYDPLWLGRFHSWRLTKDGAAYSAGATWNLFNSFRDAREAHQSGLERLQAEESLQEALQGRAIAAARAYLVLFLRQRLEEVASVDVAAQRAQFDVTKDLYQHGMKSRSDLLKSETDWRSSHLRLLERRADVRRALFDFNQLVDRDPEAPAVLAEPGGEPRLPGAGTAELSAAYERRPETRRARLALKLAGSRAADRLQDLLPRLSADARYTMSRDATFGDPAMGSGRSRPVYNIGLNLSLPVGFNGYSQAQRWRAARSDERRLEAELVSLKRRVAQDVVFARIGLEQAVESLRFSRERELIAKDNLDLVEQQYRQGSADVIRLAQARQDHLQAQTDTLRQSHDAQLRWLEYRLAAGENIWRQ